MSESVIGKSPLKDKPELESPIPTNVASSVSALFLPDAKFTSSEQLLFTTTAAIKFVLASNGSDNAYCPFTGGYSSETGNLVTIHETYWHSGSQKIYCNLVVYPHQISYKWTGNPYNLENGEYQWNIHAFVCF